MSDVTITIGVDNRGAITGFQQVSKAVDDTSQKAKGLGGHLGDVAKIAGGIVLSQGLMKLPGLFSGFVTSASDANETLSKSNTVFKESAREIERWAQGAARDFGQSKTQALDAASTFGNLFTQIGFGAKPAAELSMSLTELASDFASFHNADITEVIQAQTAAFRGEYDALQRFVPTINAAAVETQALAETGKKNAKELTAQEKAAATYTLMMKGAGEATGDFDRTSGGLANSMRTLSAIWDDTKVKLGEILLPIVTAVVVKLVDFADVVGTVINYMKAVNEDGDTMNDWLSNLPGWLQPAVKLLGEAFVVLKDLSGLAWDAIKDGAGALKDIASASWDKVSGPLKDIAGLVWKWELAYLNGLKELSLLSWDKLKEGATALGKFADAKVDQVVPHFERLGSAIRDIDMRDLNRGFDDLKEKVKPAIDFLKPLAEQVLVALRDNAKEVTRELQPLIDAFKDLAEALKPLSPLLEPLAQILGTLLVLQIGYLLIQLRILIEVVSFALVVAIDTATAYVKAFAWMLENVVVPAVTTIWEWLEKLWNKAMEAAQWIGHAGQLIGDAFEGAKNLVSGPITTILGWLDAVISKAQAAIDILGKVNPIDDIGGAVGGAVGGVRSVFDQVMGGGGGAGTPTGAYNQPLTNIDGTWYGANAAGSTAGPGAQHFVTITVGTINAETHEKGRQAAGDLAYSLAAAGAI